MLKLVSWLRLSSWMLMAALSGCATHTKDLTTDIGTVAEGDRLKESGFYEEARQQYFRIKTEFSQSPLQVQTDLKIAQSYFDEESYTAAANAYEDFIKTHPGRPEIPEALYKLGLCYAQQMPSTPQRDTRSSAKTIDTFTRLMVDYPDNPYATEAQQQIEKAREQLADHIFEIARFYERMGEYDSAARRYAEFTQQFVSNARYEEAFAREIKNLRRSGQSERAESRRKEFEEKFSPQSKFRSMIAP